MLEHKRGTVLHFFRLCWTQCEVSSNFSSFSHALRRLTKIKLQLRNFATWNGCLAGGTEWDEPNVTAFIVFPQQVWFVHSVINGTEFFAIIVSYVQVFCSVYRDSTLH
jgi:hypothetical protein